MTSTKIESREQFDELLTKSTYVDFAINLNGGLFSRKEIARNTDGSYFIFNCIDGSTLTIGEQELWDVNSELQNIGKALSRGGLFHLNYN